MRTALWETSPGALAALLNSGAPLNKCDLYSVVLLNGQTLRWTSSESAFVGPDSQVWVLGPGIERSRCKWTTGVEVDTLTLTLTTDAARPIPVAGQPLLAYIRAGGFANARLQLIRCFWGAGDAGPVGALLWFVGRVADVPEIDRQGCTLSVKSELSRLNVQVPRDVFSAQCARTVYDTECGVNRAAYVHTGTATAASSQGNTRFTADLAAISGMYNLGTLTFTGGANTGISRTVKWSNDQVAGGITYDTALGLGGVQLLSPLPQPVAVGDTFTVVPGCDGLQSTCSAKFNNLIRFKGQPYIPQAETVS